MIVQGHFQKRVQTEVCIDSTPALAQDRELRRRAWAEKIWLESFRAIHTAIKTTSEPILTSRNTKDHKNSKFCHSTWLPWQHHQRKLFFFHLIFQNVFVIHAWCTTTGLPTDSWSFRTWSFRLKKLRRMPLKLNWVEETPKNASHIELGWRNFVECQTKLDLVDLSTSCPMCASTPPISFGWSNARIL